MAKRPTMEPLVSLDGQVVIRVTYKRETEEYKASWFENGKYSEDKTGYFSDFDDAVNTAKTEMARYNNKHPMVMLKQSDMVDWVAERAEKSHAFMSGGGRTESELQAYQQGQVEGAMLAAKWLRDHKFILLVPIDGVLTHVFNRR